MSEISLAEKLSMLKRYSYYCSLLRFMYLLKVQCEDRMSFLEFKLYKERVLLTQTESKSHNGE